ncbi:MAG TPA: polysaccharide pyruvyl transferase family protein [Nocardioidaceae bacterium]|nr:polysaccharide pyruvyl transferase family protein [Nocardioidaceae bacterium]
MRVAILGAALSANKGAAAMAESVIAELPNHIGPCEFDLLTTYPAQDRALVHAANVRVVPLDPVRLAALHVPLAALAGGLRRLRLPHRWLLRTEALRALDGSDVVVDVAGISFVDGRGIPTLGYNTLMTGLPLLLGRPVVKTAQALGPFEQRLNRTLARLVLRRLATVCARGQGTRAHLDGLGLDNVVDAADLAFALPEAGELDVDLVTLLDERLGGGEFAVVMPSQVVANLCAKTGVDYVGGMTAVMDGVSAELGRPVLIVPHSYRAGQGPGRMNDGPVARELAAACTSDDVHLVDRDLSPRVLRAIVDRSSLLITSRFHGMVSGMATATPTVVIGWSHKYREVMSGFGVERNGLSHEALADPASVVETVVRAWKEQDELSRSMSAALDGVRAEAAHNFEAVAGALHRGERA